ncbi:MAG: chromosome segregation protein SMC [Candidatus Aminicenantes bacterium]|nr:chromosome segregation protein SMC [Candidatus Aminicenantes bacterium]
MIIKRLELQGFKSFSERTKIVFHPGITAIVGPNGTGKSNIVDALLWVLSGKRLKTLRGERGSDLIFNGNTKTPPVSMADVNLILGDGDEDLIINHRFFRSGEGEYRMNGKVVRLKDIHDHLWKKAIAETEYFVIEQGSIGVFLSSKPLEKRQLLEEAAGTAFYKDKKKQAEKKLENSEQNMDRLEDIIAEVARGKNSLKRQASAAIRYRQLRETIREYTLFLFREKIHNLEKSQAETAVNYRRCLEHEQDLVSRLKSEERHLAEKRKEVWEIETSNKQEKEDLFALKTQLSRLESDQDKEEKRIDYFAENRAKAKKDKEELQNEKSALEEEKTASEDTLLSLNRALEQKQKELEEISQDTQVSDDNLQQKQEKIESLRSELLEKLSIQTEIKNEASRYEKEVELIMRQEDKLKLQIDEQKTLFNEKGDTIKQNTVDLEKLQKDLRTKTEETTDVQTATEHLNSEIENLQGQLEELEKKKDQNVHHLQALEKLEEKERGEDMTADIPGSLGILADLIETDPDHALLIDVFWKEEAKANLIAAEDFLKNLSEHQPAGNYFLFSSHKKGSVPEEVEKDPRVIGLLKAAIQFDSKIKDSFSQFEEAVIVQDIKTAVELWLQYPTINSLTMKGELLCASGLLKIGPKKEGMFSLSQEMKALKETTEGIDTQISPLTRRIEEKLQTQRDLQEKKQEASSYLSKLYRQIDEKEKDKVYYRSETQKIESNVYLLKKELDVLLEEKQEKSLKLEDLTKTIKELEDAEAVLKKDVQEEEEHLTCLRGNISQSRKFFFELQSGVDITQEKINNTKSQIRTISQRTQSIESKMDSLDEEYKLSKAEENKSKMRIHEFSSKTSKLNKKIEDKQTQEIDHESRLKTAQNEQQKMEQRLEERRETYEAKKEDRVQWEIKKAERDRDIANCEESCWQELKKTLDEVKKDIQLESLPDINVEEYLSKAKEKLQTFKAVNLMAEEEYLIQKERYEFLTQERDDLRDSIDTTKEAIRRIDQESKTQFLSALHEVNKNFKDVFAILFEGGHAELKLIDPNSPLESGVEIIAQPPGKKVQSLGLLSGGEKTLTSLAFFFGLFRYKPTPFCILDEVDAALDERNLTRFLNLMKKIKDQTQFIIITHNFKTMEVADYIYGTSMGEPNITTIYAMKMEKKKQEKPG